MCVCVRVLFFSFFFFTTWTKGLPALSVVWAVVSDSSNFRMFQRCKHSWVLWWALWLCSKRNTNSYLVWSGSTWSWFSAGVNWQSSTSFQAVYTGDNQPLYFTVACMYVFSIGFYTIGALLHWEVDCDFTSCSEEVQNCKQSHHHRV